MGPQLFNVSKEPCFRHRLVNSRGHPSPPPRRGCAARIRSVLSGYIVIDRGAQSCPVDCAAVLLATAACALLTSADISAVQGEAPMRTKPSASESPGLSVERCFFELRSFPKSISLEVTRGPGGRALWRRSFHEDRGAGRQEEEEKDQPPPR